MPYTQSIFIDTTAFLALINSDDENYKKALTFINTWHEQLPEYKNLITSDYIVSETISKIRFWIGNEEAIEFGNNLLHSSLVDIIYTKKEVFNRAWEIFKLVERDNIKKGYIKIQGTYFPGQTNYHPKISYTDAATLACIELYKIPALFAFDQDLVYLAQISNLGDLNFLNERDLKVYPENT